MSKSSSCYEQIGGGMVKSAMRDESEIDQAQPSALLIPERLAVDRWIVAGILILSFAYSCLFRRYTSLDPDEGIILQGAERILHGEVLYRDFFSYFTPGSYYWAALLFKVFGNSMIVARTTVAVYGGFYSAFVYLIARRVCSRWVSLLTAYFIAITCLPWRFMALHNWDSTFLVCGAIYCVVWLLQEPHWGWAWGAGTLISLAVLFEQSKGGGLILGIAFGAALLAVFAGKAISLGVKPKISLAAGLLWPFALTLVYFAAHHAALPAITDWLWPLHHYSEANHVFYGSQNWSDSEVAQLLYKGPLLVRILAWLTVSPSFLLPVLPILGIGLLAHWANETRTNRMPAQRGAYFVLIGSAQAGLLLSVLMTRPDIIHFVYLAPVFYLTLAWGIEANDIPSHILRAAKPLLALVAFLAFSALGGAFLVRNAAAKTIIETPRGELRANSPDEVLESIQTHVAPGSRILIHPYLPLYYFLTETFSPTRYEYLQPGMHTPLQDEEALRDITADQTVAAFLELDFNEKIPRSWPNTPIRFVASDPVTDFLLVHYRPCSLLNSASEWRFIFLVRRDHSCPK